jgi:hypothetical protein
MKGIKRGMRPRKKYDGSTYYYFSMATRKRETISRADLEELNRTLPVKVKETMRKIELFKVPMTPQEQLDALTLCSVSIYCFKGGPNMDMPGISMEDYSNDFYIEMVKTLKTWDPNKGPWAFYVRYVRLHTIRAAMKRWESIRKSAEVRNFHALSSREIKNVDWESLQKLGIQASEGHRVVNHRPSSR